MDGYEEQEYLSSLFCDLSKAFDCVSHGLLLKKLKYYNFNNNSIRLVDSYLKDRHQVVRVGSSISTPAHINIGVPQGSILGPVLFLIFINDLPMGHQAQCVLFADDTTVFARGGTEMEAMHSLNVARAEVEEWFVSNGLVLNQEKTQSMMFTLKHSMLDPGTTHIKFLGVCLDSTLKWQKHVESVCGRLSGSVFVMRNLVGCVSQETLRTAYYALFHSVMSYAIMAWGHSSHAARVFRLQRRIIRLMAGIGYRDDCRNAFRTIGILTFPSVYVLQSLLYIKQAKNLTTYEDTHSHNTRNKSNIIPAHCRLGRCQNRPEYKAVNFYNKLPMKIRELPLTNFKSTLKKY